MNNFMTYVLPHLYSVPYYVIWLGGIVYAFVHRKRHPRTSLFAGLALGIMLANSLISTMVSSYFQYNMLNGFNSAFEYTGRMQALSCLTIPFSMVAWLLLLIATFGWKKLTEPEVIESDKPQEFLL